MTSLTDYRQPGNPLDERTEVLALPLPHWLNDSHDDVLRLRTALELIDSALQLMGLDMNSRDAAISAAVDALKNRAVLLEYAAARPSAVLYGYDAQGRVASIEQTVTGQKRTTTFTYDAQGRVATAAYPVASGATRTDSYQYDAQGRAAGIASEENQP